ncbi:MAG TPA: hypothetical protein VMZ92_20625 [Planctomycetota bacterium]|nr:hypothetical protein [Planctomycetota bacterium]
MIRKLFLIVVVLGVAGCVESWPLRRQVEYPSKPYNMLALYGIEKVAVVVLNASDAEVDIREAAQVYSMELQRSYGIDVFPPAVARAAVLQQKLQLPEQAHVLAKRLGVDALIVGFITDYEPYDHPRVGVLLMVYPAAVDPNAVDTAVALGSVNRVYDSDTKEVAEQVRAFAARRDAQETPLGSRKYLLVMSEYMKFVADRSIRDLFDTIARPGRPTRRTPEPEAPGTVTDDETMMESGAKLVDPTEDEVPQPDVEEREP